MSVGSSVPLVCDAQRTRIFFVCIPRSGSTALLKCLSFIDGVEAWFEPYVLSNFTMERYKTKTGEDLPTDWSEENSSKFDKAADYMASSLPLVLEGKKLAFSEVKCVLDGLKSDKVMVKDMSNSFCNRLQYLPSADSGFKYIFLIRDPKMAISSFRKASYNSTKDSHGRANEDFDITSHVSPYYASSIEMFKNSFDAWRHVQQNLDPQPLIIDFEDLMANPKPFLQKICEVGGLKFHDGLLKWDASHDVVHKWKNPGGVPDILASVFDYWHQVAINSSCFRYIKKEKPALSSVTKDVLRAVVDGTKYYDEMYKYRFRGFRP